MIFVGLGNPGEKYENTRHNVGRDILMRIHDSHPESFTPWRTQDALKCRTATAHNHITFVLPQTFMNRSGEAVRLFTDYYRSSPENIAVVHDDLDLPVGDIKISYKRGSGGHNGVESVTRELGTNAFVRIRIGIASRGEDGEMQRPEGEWVASRFVLAQFTEQEKEVVFGLDAHARFEELVWQLAQSKLEDVMTTFNARSNTSETEE